MRGPQAPCLACSSSVWNMHLDAYLQFGGFSLMSWMPWTLQGPPQNQPTGTGHPAAPTSLEGPSYHPRARFLSCPSSQNWCWLLSQTALPRGRASFFTFLLPAFHICPQKYPFGTYSVSHSRSLCERRPRGNKLLNIISLLGAFYEFQVWLVGGSFAGVQSGCSDQNLALQWEF